MAFLHGKATLAYAGRVYIFHAMTLGKLEDRPCTTRDLKIHGYFPDAPEKLGDLAIYGSDAEGVCALARAT